MIKNICLSLLLVSNASFAVGQKVLEQSVETINLGLIGAASTFAFLVLTLLISKFNLYRLRRKLARHDSEMAAKQALLNDFKVGMLHINGAGEIIFANTVAAFLLGSNQKSLTNRSVFEFFNNDEQEQLSKGLSSPKYSHFQTYVKTSKRHLQLGFVQHQDEINKISNVISLVDISNYQTEISVHKDQLNYYESALDSNQIGQLSIDLEAKTFSANQVFANLLDRDDIFSGELKDFTALIDKKDIFDWEQAITQAKAKDRFELNLGILIGHDQQPKVSGTVPVDNIHSRVLPARLVGMCREKDKAGNSVRFDFVVYDRSEIEESKRLVQASYQQIKTHIHSNPNPVYVLDNESRFVDCNTAFEKLFNVKLKSIQQKGIEVITGLPKHIVKLHSETGTNFGGLNVGHEKEFEVTQEDGSTHIIKLKLKFYSDDKNNRAGAVCMLQDLTELTRAKQKLVEERKHFTTILDLAPAAVATIDAEDRIIQANIAMTDRLGLSERELKKDTFYQLFSDPSNAGKAAKTIHKTGRLRAFQAKLKGKKDELHPSELHVDLLNKERQEYLCWISDRTGEQYHQDKFDGLLLHSSMPMAILGEGGFTKLNPAACDFFEVEDEQELLGSTPYADNLNIDHIATEELERHITKVKLDGQAKSMPWQHQVNQQLLPCHVTYVPMYKGKEFDSILCIWADFREIQQADQARIEAINKQKAAAQQAEEKQKLFESSQKQLETKTRSLVDTESKLQVAQEHLSEKQNEFSDLQQAHENITHHLKQLQCDYNASREELSQVQSANSELTIQLQESTEKVRGLQEQRNQISDALQNSEQKYKTAQEELVASERNTEELKQQQLLQQAKMNDFVAEIEELQQSIGAKDQQITEVGSQIMSLQSELNRSDDVSDKLRKQLMNQRKASEEAQKQKRNIEQTYKMAQSELSNKVRHVEHLQSEMQKFEEMSNQQKGDMEKQQSQLTQELAEKQQLLQQTQEKLNETERAATREKQAREEQQKRFDQLQRELSEMESRSQSQQEEMVKIEQQWVSKQHKVQQELEAKQLQLQETEQYLHQAKQQSEAEKAQRKQQEAVFETLQAELAEMETRHQKQQEESALRDQKWQQQQQDMHQELLAKQQLLQVTEQNLKQAKKQTKEEKKEQQALFDKLQAELLEMESRNSKQQQQMAQSDAEWQLQQQKVQEELKAKQQQLQQTEKQLLLTKQQTEAEKAQKEQQQALYEKLQEELLEVEKRSEQQEQAIAQSDQDWKRQQQALKDEVEAKRQQLKNTQVNLDDIKRQADAEKLARIAQQQKLEQLTVELTDVESRAIKQREMIQGSDEQWRAHHAEIEEQKKQLQLALVEAEKQNNQLKQKLHNNLEQLQDAESQVNETQSAEQSLQLELSNAKQQADFLQTRLALQEQQEKKLQQQLAQQQRSLQGSEKSIQSLEEKQAQLTEELEAVQKEYSQSKESLHAQHSDHEALTKQLQKLEKELTSSKNQLDSKEMALQDAQQQLQTNQAKLAEQESALLSAHKEELQQAAEQVPVSVNEKQSAIGNIEMPSDPSVWFDLLPYLQKYQSNKALPVALTELMDELQKGIEDTNNAVDEDDVTKILSGARKLGLVADKVNSDALTDVVNRLEADCRQGLVDNIAISWPTVQRSLNNTLRVIFSHLHA
ncbi:PAS domain S-box protein [Paraglaciecola sp. 2405UD69-4]|uniref:PAS domain S-box protein n=1 Tax=Paraglaciecola sp. 2405UD69-4 TaxID=3391836 RepID=UPI0039C95904